MTAISDNKTSINKLFSSFCSADEADLNPDEFKVQTPIIGADIIEYIQASKQEIVQSPKTISTTTTTTPLINKHSDSDESAEYDPLESSHKDFIRYSNEILNEKTDLSSDSDIGDLDEPVFNICAQYISGKKEENIEASSVEASNDCCDDLTQPLRIRNYKNHANATYQITKSAVNAKEVQSILAADPVMPTTTEMTDDEIIVCGDDKSRKQIVVSDSNYDKQQHGVFDSKFVYEDPSTSEICSFKDAHPQKEKVVYRYALWRDMASLLPDDSFDNIVEAQKKTPPNYVFDELHDPKHRENYVDHIGKNPYYRNFSESVSKLEKEKERKKSNFSLPTYESISRKIPSEKPLTKYDEIESLQVFTNTPTRNSYSGDDEVVATIGDFIEKQKSENAQASLKIRNIATSRIKKHEQVLKNELRANFILPKQLIGKCLVKNSASFLRFIKITKHAKKHVENVLDSILDCTPLEIETIIHDLLKFHTNKIAFNNVKGGSICKSCCYMISCSRKNQKKSSIPPNPFNTFVFYASLFH